jgi:predicted lactoylglutathione lyase
MATYSRPGVYVQEVALPQTIQLPDTSNAVGAMTGALAQGPSAAPTLVSSWSDFVKTFGGLNDSYPTTWAAYNFYANGGRNLYVRRVLGDNALAGTVSVTDSATSSTVVATVTAASAQATTATVTAASAAGGTVTYTATNTFEAGQSVSISGLSTTAFNLSAVTIATATSSTFTVTNAATGTAVTGATATATAVSAKITYTASNSFTVGQTVSITGLSTSTFNITNATIVTRSATQFTITSAATGTAVTGASATATVVINPALVFTVNASNAGAWSQNYSIQVVPAGVSTRFGLNVYYTSPTGVTTITESYTDLSMSPTDKYFFRSVINSSSGLINIPTTGLDVTKTPYTTATSPSALTGGNNGEAPTRAQYNAVWESFDPIQNPLVIYAADAAYNEASTSLIHGDAMTYALSREDSFVVVDTPSGLSVTAAKDSVDATAAAGPGAEYLTAAYYPWVNIPDTNKIPGVTRPQAPGAIMVGQYLATDASRGVYKTPAGLGNSIALAVSTEHLFTNAELDELNTRGNPINAIRNVPGAGIVVMGGRTLENTPNNRYINVRRSLQYITKQLTDLSAFAVFENNDTFLWRRLDTVLSNFLLGYWSEGGLRGNSQNQAFFVKVDETTTTFTDMQNGRVNIEVGVALEYPAEFVVIKLGQLTGNASA